MQTKLSVFCDKLIEAGWLAAVIVVPLFMNIHSQRSFESDKIALLRSIALVMAVAWVIKELETRSWKLEASAQHSVSSIRFPVSRTPLVLPALILLMIYIFTSITSIAPRLSFWGSYQRLQGAYTALSYFAVFLLILLNLRTREQLDRLVTVILLTSLPISLYGIMQHFGLDPFIWAGHVPAHRAVSTMGNPIFVAAYLIMVVPLTMKRLVKSMSALLANKEGAASIILATSYFLFLGIQLICVILTQSRGPFIGLVGGFFFFVLLTAVSRRRKGLVVMMILTSMGIILFLAILNLPNTPLAPLKEVPYFQRLLTMELHGRPSIWEGTVSAIAADPIRTIIGYGPESIYLVLSPCLSPDFVRWHGIGRTADRCHNETFEALMTTGLIGFAAYLLLFGSLFYYGFKWLGLIVNSRQRALFMALFMIGALFGAMVPWLMRGTFTFAGLGIPAGILVALIAYLVISLFYCQRGNGQDSGRQFLVITLFSAIAAHFIEIQFGIAIAATRLYFWVYAALMTVVALFLAEEPMMVPAAAGATPVKPPSRRRKRDKRRPGRKLRASGVAVGHWNAPLTSRSLLVGLVLVTMGFIFITTQQFLSSKPLARLMPFLITWLFGGLLVIAEVSKEARASSLFFLWDYALLSLGLFFIFFIFHGGNLPPGGDPIGAIVFYYLFLFLAIAAIALALSKGMSLPTRLWRGDLWLFYPMLILGVVVLISITNLNVVQADIYYKQGLAYERDERWDESIGLYRRALALAPNQDHYYKTLGWTYLRRAESDAARRDAWLEEAGRAFQRGREISPLDPDHTANLGYAYLNWEQLAADSVDRVAMLNKALDYFQQAVAMSPHIQGASLKEDMVRTHILLGDAYMDTGEVNQSSAAYKQAVELDPDEALQQALKDVEASPDSFTSHRNLAMIYRQLGRIDEAIEEAKAARDLAPAEERARLDDLVCQFETQEQ